MCRKIEYYYTSIKDASGEGFRFLKQLADKGVDLMALTAVPFGPDKAQLTLFPMNAADLVKVAKAKKIALDGPHSAIFIRGEDRVGAFAGVLAKLAEIDINVFSVQGMTDGRGGFGYIVYVRPSDIDQAMKSLGAS